MVRMASLGIRLREVGLRSELGPAPRSPVSFGFADILAPLSGPLVNRAGLSGSKRKIPWRAGLADAGKKYSGAESVNLAQQRSRPVHPPVGLFCLAPELIAKGAPSAGIDQVCSQFWRLNQKIQPCSPLCAIQAGSSPNRRVSRCHTAAARASSRHSHAHHVEISSISPFAVA
jgi:hypothetical protein